LEYIDIKRVLAGFALLILLTGCDQAAIAESDASTSTPAAESATTLDTELKQASYMLGYQRAQGLAQQTQGILDMQAFVEGVADYVDGNASQIGASQQPSLMQALQDAIAAQQAEASRGIREAGDNYRAEYANKEGVVALPSGLLYEVITQGEGEKAKASDTVSTHYHGTLIDGTVFDSSVDRGQPSSFPVSGVIAGWTEALQLMAVGSKWRLVVPPDLAYGERGAGGDIAPGATLIFEVELLEIK